MGGEGGREEKKQTKSVPLETHFGEMAAASGS